MSDFDTARQELASEVLAAFGKPATYTFQDATTLAIDARLDQNVEAMGDEGSGFVLFPHTIKFREEVVPSPKRLETITFDDSTKVWKLGRLLGNNGGLLHYEVS